MPSTPTNQSHSAIASCLDTPQMKILTENYRIFCLSLYIKLKIMILLDSSRNIQKPTHLIHLSRDIQTRHEI